MADTPTQCIEREREAAETRAFHVSECACPDCKHWNAKLEDARAATDEAVKAAEGLVRAATDFLDCHDSGDYQSEGLSLDALRDALTTTQRESAGRE